ncbi:hypothetical protein EVAR_61066_1 [Eumeta japonica]|uniref:Uncharacterized protein n=1 Tax=Eumeta variegata TaxID=151549 RepID=A0A4C1Z8M5_EUMVA|nr:hypothetical protein EVAR_61066_1 [Eumeta japonica]
MRPRKPSRPIASRVRQTLNRMRFSVCQLRRGYARERVVNDRTRGFRGAKPKTLIKPSTYTAFFDFVFSYLTTLFEGRLLLLTFLVPRKTISRQPSMKTTAPASGRPPGTKAPRVCFAAVFGICPFSRIKIQFFGRVFLVEEQIEGQRRRTLRAVSERPTMNFFKDKSTLNLESFPTKYNGSCESYKDCKMSERITATRQRKDWPGVVSVRPCASTSTYRQKTSVWEICPACAWIGRAPHSTLVRVCDHCALMPPPKLEIYSYTESTEGQLAQSKLRSRAEPGGAGADEPPAADCSSTFYLKFST